MVSDLHFWNLSQLIAKKSIQEKFLFWVDRQNKLDVESQHHEHLILLPNLKEDSRNFKLDTNRLFVVKGG